MGKKRFKKTGMGSFWEISSMNGRCPNTIRECGESKFPAQSNR